VRAVSAFSKVEVDVVSCGKVERVPGFAVDPNVIYQNGIHKNLTCFEKNITFLMKLKKKPLLA
jgi:hypothetical protein